MQEKKSNMEWSLEPLKSTIISRLHFTNEDKMKKSNLQRHLKRILEQSGSPEGLKLFIDSYKLQFLIRSDGVGVQIRINDPSIFPMLGFIDKIKLKARYRISKIEDEKYNKIFVFKNGKQAVRFFNSYLIKVLVDNFISKMKVLEREKVFFNDASLNYKF
jgi:hypothetical protein